MNIRGIVVEFVPVSRDCCILKGKGNDNVISRHISMLLAKIAPNLGKLEYLVAN